LRFAFPPPWWKPSHFRKATTSRYMLLVRVRLRSHARPGEPSCQSVCVLFADGFRVISSSTGTRRVSGSFIDTNVLICLASTDAAKANQAETIVRKGGVISVQALNEVTNVARRKMRLSWTENDQLL